MLILPALAAEGAERSPAPNLFELFMPFIFVFVIFYFLWLRPQKKQQEKHRLMLDALKKGDDVVTGAGLYAQIADVRDDHYILKIADNVRVKATKASISHKVTPQGVAATEEKSK